MSKNQTRVIGQSVDIDYASTHAFFEQRAEKINQLGPLRVTMYQDRVPGLAEARDRYEKKTALSLFKMSDRTKVLDIGCGTGRWGFFLVGKAHSYLGIDYSEKILGIAQKELEKYKVDSNFTFQALPCTDLEVQKLKIKPPFDLILIAGLCVYLNDKDCLRLLSQVPELAGPQARVYIREPIATAQRLTLREFYSEDLGSRYNAIYRTDADYQELFAQGLAPCGFKLRHQADLFPPHLSNRKDTKQKVYLWARGRYA